MSELEQLRAEHASAVLNFELENRAYFARSINDRGDQFFDRFSEDFDRALAEQESGVHVFHVLMDHHGAVLGRFNLYRINDGVATVGYRVAQHNAGHGIATAAVRELCLLAARRGLRTLLAATSDENGASRRVLIKAGFVPDGPADPSEIGGKSGTRFRRELTVT